MKEEVGCKVTSASLPKHDTIATRVFGSNEEIAPWTAAILLPPPGMLVSTTKTINVVPTVTSVTALTPAFKSAKGFTLLVFSINIGDIISAATGPVSDTVEDNR